MPPELLLYVNHLAVGISQRCINCLAHNLLDSNLAASMLGATTCLYAILSAMPPAISFSGPTTVNSG